MMYARETYDAQDFMKRSMERKNKNKQKMIDILAYGF